MRQCLKWKWESWALHRSIVFAAGLLLATIGFGVLPASAQFGALGGAARRAAEEARKKADEAKRQEEEAKRKQEQQQQQQQPAPATPAASPQSAGATPAAQSADSGAAPAPSFQSYSKFDFVPGEKVVAVEDFTQDQIGDFPARWNTDASGEIVTIAGRPGRWLKLTRAGFFTPEFITEWPDNATLEFDMAVPPTMSAGFPLEISIVQLTDLKKPVDWQSGPNNITVTAHPMPSDGASQITLRQDGQSGASNAARTPQLAVERVNPVHISVWRQRQRVRVYMNEEKIWDLPRAASASAKFNALLFFVPGGCGNCEYYLGNIRVAAGAPDTRNKILTEGKWVTHGILFDVNSDRIKPESYGSLKEIAGVLTENADVKVQIVGHTDSDGDEAANMDLSRRRSASVKAALAGEFKIDSGRMETDGKGESQPVDSNDNAAGKANNRRVEFIKK